MVYLWNASCGINSEASGGSQVEYNAHDIQPICGTNDIRHEVAVLQLSGVPILMEYRMRKTHVTGAFEARTNLIATV